MILDFEKINKLEEKYGFPLYVFDEKAFIDNYYELQETFRAVYEKYNIAYSYKTNYTPYIAGVVKTLGGYAEVVSEMEYSLAKYLGYEPNRIIFNGPSKGSAGREAFLNGCIVNVDSLEELQLYCEAAKECRNQKFEIGIRVNIDVEQDFVSRFGIDIAELSEAFELVKKVHNLEIVGIHCHISRCRGLFAWKRRTEIMLEIADSYFKEPPKYIDLGSGMFGHMETSFAEQFDNVPSYKEYAEVVAKRIADHYKEIPIEKRPLLFTEPGTTLINKYVDFLGKIETIKQIREKNFAVLNCSIHNLGETCLLKNLPVAVIPSGRKQENYDSIDFTGYTCLEQDVMRKNYEGEIAVGDYVRFGNVGGYSNVLKPPFIRPNCAMIAIDEYGKDLLIKKVETFEDIFGTYVFEREI